MLFIHLMLELETSSLSFALPQEINEKQVLNTMVLVIVLGHLLYALSLPNCAR